MFRLRFDRGEIPLWSEQYNYPVTPAQSESIAFLERERYLTRPHFIELARWKSRRIVKICSSNDAAFVEEVTRAALGSTNEQFRIEALQLLKGVSWAMASTILHFGIDNTYPLLDYRALWSLGVEIPREKYSLSLWRAYVEYTKQLASEVGVTMRELDCALWQYSKENQKRSRDVSGHAARRIPAP